jgi:hypothetical protein
MDTHVYVGFGLSLASYFGRYAVTELPKRVAWAGVAAGVFVMSVPLWGDDMKPPAGSLLFAVAGFVCFGIAAHLYWTQEIVRQSGPSLPINVLPPSPLPTPTPTPEVPKTLSPKFVRELLEALSEAKTLHNKFVDPTMGQIDSWAANWRGVLRNNNGAQLYSRLRDELKTQVWEKIDSLIDQNKDYQKELEWVFALDHPAAKNELSRALQTVVEAIQRLPPNAPPALDDLLEPQFKELIKQSNLGWDWVTRANQRLNKMTEDVNTRGIVEYK